MPDLGSSGSKFAMLLMTEAKRLRRLLTFLKGRAWAIKVLLQLKLLPTRTYAQTILKATELLLIYRHADKAEGHVQQITNSKLKDEQLDKLEVAVQSN